MSKCEEGISLVELVHEQHEEIVILKAERDRYRKENTYLNGECQRIIMQRDGLADTVKRYRKALIKIRGDGKGAIWQDIVREIDAALGDDVE